MCPDKEILSAYLDGEVPHPWDEKIEKHLEICADCASNLAHMKAVSGFLKSADLSEAEIMAGQERVYARLMEVREEGSMKPRIWKRQIPVPVPLLAAAAVLVVVLGIGMFTAGSPKTAPLAQGTPEAAAGSDIYSVKLSEGQVKNLEEVLRNRDQQIQVFIDLPPASRFDAGTEPQFIRAADYHRQ